MIKRGEDYLRLELAQLVLAPRFLSIRFFAAGEVDGLGAIFLASNFREI